MGRGDWVRAVTACAIVLLAATAVSGQAGQVPSPRKIKDVNPIYPRESLERGDEDAFILELTVAPSGQVERARLLRSTCPRLEAAAVADVLQWRFESVRVNGTPIPFTVVTIVPFRLPPRYRSRAGRAGACTWEEPGRPITE